MTGITSAQVAAAADRLTADGTRVTIEAVRSHLGTGSPNTVHKHLKLWRAGVKTPTAHPLTISQSLTAALHDELMKTAAEARAQLEEKLADFEANIDSLEKGGSMLESERDGLLQKVQELTTERDNIRGKSTQQEIALCALEERAAKDLAAAENARVALAQEKLSSAHLLSDVESNRVEISRLKDALDVERTSRVSAEKSAAVLTAELQSTSRVAERAHEQLGEKSEELRMVRAQAQKQLDEKSEELRAARVQAQGQQSEQAATHRELQSALRDAQRSATEATHQMQQAIAATQSAVAAAKDAEREAAELRGRLQAISELHKDAQTA